MKRVLLSGIAAVVVSFLIAGAKGLCAEPSSIAADCGSGGQDPSLIGYWKLKDDCRDYSGHGNHGVNHGVNLDSGIFDGVSAYVEVPTNDSLKLGTGDFSVSVWVSTEKQLDDIVGDVLELYDPELRRGITLCINSTAGGFQSHGTDRYVFFGIDNARQSEWQDCGRLSEASNYVSESMTVYRGKLYAATTGAKEEKDWCHVYRYEGGQKWLDCGRVGAAKTQGVGPLIVHDGNLYAATWTVDWTRVVDGGYDAGRVYRYVGGTEWQDCGQPSDNRTLNCIASYRGKLYVGGGPETWGVFTQDDAEGWKPSKVFPKAGPERCFPHSMMVFNGKLFTCYPSVFSFDGQQWTYAGIPIVDRRDFLQLYCFAAHQGKLCIGSWPESKVAVYQGGEDWQEIGRVGEDGTEVNGLVVYNGKLYGGSLPRAEVCRYDGGTKWTSLKRFYSPEGWTPAPPRNKNRSPTRAEVNEWARLTGLTIYDGKLFASTGSCTSSVDDAPCDVRGKVFSMEAGKCVSSSEALGAGWKHIAAVRDRGILKLYIDSKLVATSSGFQQDEYDVSVTRPLRIGFGQTDYFNGKISELRIYNRALSAVQIQSLSSSVQLGARDDKDYSSELPRIPPKTPAESLKSLRVHAGFRIELAAAEPLLASPVALDFDEDNRLYVAEYPEFNQSSSQQSHGHGRVRMLEDSDGDGNYDKSTIFLADLDSPTAVCCYDGGVFVGVVPNILYAKDTNGDGKADVCRTIYTGFARDVGGEAMLNSFRWLFDNRFHVSTSFSGGQVRHSERKDAMPVSVRGQGFLFDPRTEAFEAASGGGQHGLTMDDWGRTFVCTNHEPVHLLLYDRRYLTRNPYLDGPAAAVKIAPGGYNTKVFRISPNEPWRVVRTRLRTTGVEDPHPTEGDQPSGYFTAASGVTIYRGAAWPSEYRDNVFVGEVANNLIYRARLEPDGVGLIALRADQNVEFLASSDIWFRPVQMANGPDGALYVLDMYRNLIQSAAFLPPAIVKHLDVSGGFDMGRLYRIVPENFQQPKPPRLSSASTAELVALLEHPNGWHRDTASRLLYQRQDPSAIAPLKELAAEAKSPLARMHSLYALDGLRALDVTRVLHGLRDVDSRVREHAIRLAESFESVPEVRARLEQLTDDPDLRVRYQLAFSIGSVNGEMPTRALVQLARRDSGDSWFRLAILSSVNGRAGAVFKLLVADREYRAVPHGRALLLALSGIIGSANRGDEITSLVQGLDALPESESALRHDLGSALIAKLRPASREQFARLAGNGAGTLLGDLLRDALKTAPDEMCSVDDRVAAIRLIGLAPFADHQDLFRDLLKVRHPQGVQASAVETLARFDEPRVAAVFLEAWPGFSPQLRASALEALFSRPGWIWEFLDAVEQGKLNRADVDPARIQALATHASPRFRARAAELFAATKLTRRQDVVAAYQKALQLKGDRARGKTVFKKECSACHQLEGEGTQTGADLNALRDQGMEAILLNILDPNREVKPQFHSYAVLTDEGRTLTGMITAETANSLTIGRVDGTTETVLRIHIDELKSTGLSFMPEGLEKQIDVPAMADLLAYLTSIK